MTAAFIPSSKPNTNSVYWNGHLTQSSFNYQMIDRTCRRPIGMDMINCGWTETGMFDGFSSTSGVNDLNSVSFEETDYTGTGTSDLDMDNN